MLDTVIFELAGRPVLLLDLICSVLGLTCVFLAGRNSKYNFWVGYLYTAALFLLFMHRNLYASLLLQPVSLVINMLGHYRWTHPLWPACGAGRWTACSPQTRIRTWIPALRCSSCWPSC